MAYFDPVNTQFTQPFDQGPETPSIDAGVDTIGLVWDPKTGSFRRTGTGGGGGGFAPGGTSEAQMAAELNQLDTTIKPGGFLPSGGAGASSGLTGALKNWFTDPGNLVGLGSLIAALASGNGGGGSGAESEEARRMQQITEQRMRRVDPLHQAVTQLAWGRLPINARQGVSPPQPRPLPE